LRSEIRNRELRAVEEKIDSFLEEAAKSQANKAAWIKERRPDLSLPQGIYTYLKQFQNNVYGTETTPRSNERPIGSVGNRPGGISATGIFKGMNRINNKMVGTHGASELARNLFCDLETLIVGRQSAVGDELLKWRDTVVRRWEVVLSENPENNIGLVGS
jgi:hypothetical protein